MQHDKLRQKHLYFHQIRVIGEFLQKENNIHVKPLISHLYSLSSIAQENQKNLAAAQFCARRIIFEIIIEVFFVLGIVVFVHGLKSFNRAGYYTLARSGSMTDLTVF